MTCSVMMFIDLKIFAVVASTLERRKMQCHSSSTTMPGVFDVIESLDTCNVIYFDAIMESDQNCIVIL
jgi:hypothetical protein